jgi:hypothetical protein
MVSGTSRFQVSGFGCQKKDDIIRNLIISKAIRFVILTPEH